MMSFKKLAVVLAMGIAFVSAPALVEAKAVVSHPATKVSHTIKHKKHKKTPKKHKKIVLAPKKHALTAKKVAPKTAATGWKHHKG